LIGAAAPDAKSPSISTRCIAMVFGLGVETGLTMTAVGPPWCDWPRLR
jgi:hypothetical protein